MQPGDKVTLRQWSDGIDAGEIVDPRREVLDYDDACGSPDPDGEYECTHLCWLPKGHDGDHQVTFTWPGREEAPQP